MFVSVTLCVVVYIIQFCNTLSSVEEVNYFECGVHGRFEYCLNGMADCVVGCHCHPGYYFDTETKICEPNIKLTRGFRRHYMENPTRIYDNGPTTVTENMPLLTTAFDPLTNDNDKDNDNLGEWLYNQFFKTIETQVMNKTKDGQPTRRSGNGDGKGDDKKTLKPLKSKHSKKKKKKVRGLRRKLLRITEDDSLFDSDETSSDCSGHSSESDDENSDESESHGESKEKEVKKDMKDRHHDHKKVIIFNKRPRPPLPSFIFVPGMDTPFYPPIGLPPPPIVPMYPMVPVPPVAPFVPQPGENNIDTASTTTPQPPPPNDATICNTESTTQSISTQESTTESTPEETETPKPAERSKTRPHKSRKVIPTAKSFDEMFMFRSRDPEQRPPLWTQQQLAKLKLAQQLKGKLKSRIKDDSPDLQNIVVNGETLPDAALHEDDSSIYTPISKPKHKPKKKTNVQYLSQLIHKLNNTKDKPHSNGISDDLKEFDAIKSGRRNYNPQDELLACENELTSQNNSSDDGNYYTNLGRKIACLIRSIDPKLTKCDPPPSFWERYVRSPLKRYKSHIDKFDIYSAEKNLLSLENEVSYIASTTPPLSLQDLENVLNSLHKFHSELEKFKKTPDSSSVSYNVDLLSNYPVDVQQNDPADLLPNSPVDLLSNYPADLLPNKPLTLKLTLPSNKFVELLPDKSVELLPDKSVEVLPNQPVELLPNKRVEQLPERVNDYSYFDGLLDDTVPRVKAKVNDTLSSLNQWPSHSNNSHFIDIYRPSNDDWTIKFQQNVVSEPNITNNGHEHPYQKVSLYQKVNVPQFAYLNMNKPRPHNDNDNIRKLNHHTKQSNMFSYINMVPINRKPHIKVEKYLHVPGKQHANHHLKEYQDISQLHHENYGNEQYPDTRIEKYRSEPEKYAQLPSKYTEHQVGTKLPNAPKRIAAKYSALLHKYPELLQKYPHLFEKYRELLSKNLPQKFHQFLEQRPESTSKFPHKPSKFKGSPTKYRNTLPQYSAPGKPSLSLNYPQHNRRHMHPPLYRKRKKPIHTESKPANHYFDLSSDHYIIEDISLIEAEDKEKRYVGDTAKPSFFNHDRQHLPYYY